MDPDALVGGVVDLAGFPLALVLGVVDHRWLPLAVHLVVPVLGLGGVGVGDVLGLLPVLGLGVLGVVNLGPEAWYEKIKNTKTTFSRIIPQTTKNLKVPVIADIYRIF